MDLGRKQANRSISEFGRKEKSMERKEIKSKLLMYFVTAVTIVLGILGSVPLSVKAAEEENYTVTFEAYEGHCLESWIDAINNDKVTILRSAGKSGDTYPPEKKLWLYANWKPNQELLMR